LAAGLARLQPDCLRHEPMHDDFRAGDIRHSQADISRIQTELGYEPAPDLAGALERTVSWYLSRLRPAQAVAQRVLL
ncbi:MAG: LPS biosynthesis protein WbpP, partial [Longimicrobiales bacterium]